MKLKRMKLIYMVIVGVFLIIFTCIGIYKFNLRAVNHNQTKILIEVKKGSSINDIINNLEQHNLIRSKLSTKIYVKLNHINDFKAGYYQLTKSMDVKTIFKLMHQGSTYNPNQIKITFKEGLNYRAIGHLIANSTNHTYDEVISTMSDINYLKALINEYWFLTDDILNRNIYFPLEGYLFPDTYVFDGKNTEIKVIVKSMLDQTDKVLTKYKTLINNKKYTVHEILSLAAIVELEGSYSMNDLDTIKNIAGVFYNRLNNGWSLGSDVTTYYAVKKDMTDGDLYKSELNLDNPYNTRGPNMSGKLPVGPICNPSESTIMAVLEPNINAYYYFVADKNHKVYFSKTSKEHEKIIDDLKESGMWFTW